MTQPSTPPPTIDVDVSSLTSVDNPVTGGTGGRLVRMGAVYKAVRLLVAWANAAKSASDLTTGTLPAARIAPASLSLDKLATDVATQDELDAVRGIAESAAAGGINVPRNITTSGPLQASDVGGSVRARNTSAAVATVPLLSAPDGAMISLSRLGADLSVALGVPGTTLQRLRSTDGQLKARTVNSSILLEAVRPPVPACPSMWARVRGSQFAAAANGATITRVVADLSSTVTLPDIVPTGAQCPTVHRNAANGRAGIRFNGTSNVLPLTGAWLDLLRNRPNAVIFAVIRIDGTAPTGHRTLVSFLTGNAVQPGARAQLKWRDPGLNQAMALGRRLDTESASAAANGPLAVSPDLSVLSGRWRWDTSDIFALDNGAVVGSNTSFQTDGNTSDTASVAAALGANGLANAEFFSGTVLEWAIGAWSSTVEAEFQAYAEAEYGEEWLVGGDTVA